MFTADFIRVDGEELELGNSADMLVEEESASFFEDLTDVVLLLGRSEGHGGVEFAVGRDHEEVR